MSFLPRAEGVERYKQGHTLASNSLSDRNSALQDIDQVKMMVGGLDKVAMFGQMPWVLIRI